MASDGVTTISNKKISVFDPNYPIDYKKPEVPPSYQCCRCGATNCKLWRDYLESSEYLTLLCAECSAKEQRKDIASIDKDGKLESTANGRTNQIGSRIPAIPTEGNDIFWGYTSAPKAGYEWWAKLPTHRNFK